jgi:hypothetical protein
VVLAVLMHMTAGVNWDEKFTSPPRPPRPPRPPYQPIYNPSAPPPAVPPPPMTGEGGEGQK